MNELNELNADTLFADWSEDQQSASPKSLKLWLNNYPEFANELMNWTTTKPISDYADQSKISENDVAYVRQIGIQVVAEKRAEYQAKPITISSLKDAAKQQGLSLRSLAERLGVGSSLVFKLEYRHISFASLPSKFVNQIAESLQVSLSQIQAYLQQSATLSPSASYRSDSVPQVTEQEDFLQALESCSDMTEEQKNRWR